ncbi:hypothetical protein [Burkholderia perseverans]|uniref:hypothetical protein n=1 Tax=Burkholderia perseverans TaxID=2615214 RepID=UPI001FEF9304|nr:hypothetical protein [Burkholderia perseverans]
MLKIKFTSDPKNQLTNELPHVVEIKDGTVTAVSSAVRGAADAVKPGASSGRTALPRHRAPGLDPAAVEPRNSTPTREFVRRIDGLGSWLEVDR